MNQSHDSFLQQDVFSSLKDKPAPGISIEEYFWQKAVGLHPKKNRFPYDAILLFGLIVALVVLVLTLLFLNPNSEQSLSGVINWGFPIALTGSAIFMILGLFQRISLNNNENKIEKTYRNLLSEYTENQGIETRTSSGNTEQEKLIETLDNHFLVLTDAINTNFTGLTSTISNFSREMADYSGKEIESTLNKFSKSIHGLPQQLSLALERKLEEPQQERIDFRQAVSGLLSLPVDLLELNKTLISNSNQLGEATRSSSAAIEHIANLVDRFDDTTRDSLKTTKTLNAAVENLSVLLGNVGKTTESLEASRKEMSADMLQTINEMDNNIGQAIEKSADINNDAATRFTSSIEYFQTNLENITHQISSENKNQVGFIAKTIEESLVKLKTEAESLRGSQDQIGRMIEKAVSDSAKDTNELAEKLTTSVKTLQSYMDKLVRQIGVENKRESEAISSTDGKMDQILILLRESSSAVKNQSKENEHIDEAPDTNVSNTESVHPNEEEKSKPGSSFWSFRR